jgi:hypothetical protein
MEDSKAVVADNREEKILKLEFKLGNKTPSPKQSESQNWAEFFGKI